MGRGDLIRLFALAALWGGSFIFMRIVAPTLGAVVTADSRILIAGIVLVIYFRLIGFDPQWKRFWKEYLIIGTFNSALPFTLYAYAARHIPASYSIILNTTAPLFGAIFSALWLADPLTRRKFLGLVLGAAGVALVARVKPAQVDAYFGLSVAACLTATLCYGLVGVYTKKYASRARPLGIAGGSQLLGGLALAVALPFSPPLGPITPVVAGNALALAVLCSGVAYVLFYRLVADVGPTKALTVTFLVPLFGMLWSVLLLGEPITRPMIGGCALILAGTVLVLQIGAKKAFTS